jgi:L-alanine-DL-glutamate epimerase-like enolase superfamily enzyme
MKIRSIEWQFLSPEQPKRKSLDAATVASIRPTALIIRITTEDGLSGLGFAPIAHPSMIAIHEGVLHLLGNQLLSSKIEPRACEEAWESLDYTATGSFGISARTVQAALDIACWDLKSKSANATLATTIGRISKPCLWNSVDAGRADLSDADLLPGCVQIRKEGAKGAVAQFPILGEVGDNASRMHCIRDSIGEDGWLSIDGQGIGTLAHALGVTLFLEDDVGPDCFEEMLPSVDRKGYEVLCQRLEVPLSAGGLLNRVADFLPLLQDGHVRFIRANPYHLGGITPLLKLSHLAELFPVSLSIKNAPELAIHFGGVEIDVDSWLFDRIGTKNFDSTHGTLRILVRPGHGIALPEKLESADWKFVS